MSIKRSTVWTGYKVHLTETCDEDLPHLLIHVETTPATTQDMEMTGIIHQALAEKHLLPAEHVMDTGYVDGEHIVTSQHTEREWTCLVRSPAAPEGRARAGQGFDHTGFTIDWQAKQATCPQGKISRKWTRHPGSHRLRGDSHPIWQTGLSGVSMPQPMYHGEHQSASTGSASSSTI